MEIKCCAYAYFILPFAPCRPGDEVLPEGLDPKVVAVYQGVGRLLTRYTAGKVPKAFKIIPNLKNWEEVGGQSLVS